MALPESFLEEVAARNPIEEVVGQYVALTRKGSNLFGLCPFHSEKTASFSVAPDKGIYYCFGCHKGGSVINFIMEIENLEYIDAVRFLAKRAGLEMPEDTTYRSTYRRQERLWALCKEAALFFHEKLSSSEGKPARDYLAVRGLTKSTVTRFGLGFSPDHWTGLLEAMQEKGYTKEELLDAGLAVRSQEKGAIYDRFRNRLMFPIIDVRGHVIGFGGRVMDDSKPKYLNSPETLVFNKRRNLFALNIVKKSKQGRIILTEGYMDAIALHQYGFDCAVASLGTALTEEHAKILAKYTNQVVITYDGDEAGQTATKRAIGLLEKTGVQVKVLRMQGAKDPDEFLKKYGADRFKVLLEKSENHREYQLLSLQSQYHLELDEEKVAFSKEAANLIATFSSAVEREVYGTRAAEAAGISPDAMKVEINRAFQRRIFQEKKKQESQILQPARTYQPKMKGMHYENLRSAIAEEGLLRLVFKEPVLLPSYEELPAEAFSSPILAKIYRALHTLADQGVVAALPALAGILSKEEMNHFSAVIQKQDDVITEEALRDYMEIIQQEYFRRKANTEKDLLTIRNQLKEKKGYGG